jgi:hypothetical protein
MLSKVHARHTITQAKQDILAFIKTTWCLKGRKPALTENFQSKTYYSPRALAPRQIQQLCLDGKTLATNFNP